MVGIDTYADDLQEPDECECKALLNSVERAETAEKEIAALRERAEKDKAAFDGAWEIIGKQEAENKELRAVVEAVPGLLNRPLCREAQVLSSCPHYREYSIALDALEGGE